MIWTIIFFLCVVCVIVMGMYLIRRLFSIIWFRCYRKQRKTWDNLNIKRCCFGEDVKYAAEYCPIKCLYCPHFVGKETRVDYYTRHLEDLYKWKGDQK